jgi:hypothetical protein
MQKITMSRYSGGIQEASGPNDFTESQWAQLKGFIPESDAVFESQWATQRIGGDSGFQFVTPIPSSVGVFLVAVKAPDQTNAGTVWWAKAPAPTAAFGTANAVTWTQLVTAENRGVRFDSNLGANQPNIPITPNPNFRFITYVPFEVYNFVKAPAAVVGNQFKNDGVLTATPKSVVSGALLHGRRPKVGGSYPATVNQQALVAYVDPEANSGAGAVKAATFPNWRRLQQKEDGTFFATREITQNKSLATRYPYLSTDDTRLPRPGVDHHPHSVKDEAGAFAPGRGVIPRGNVGTMWGNLLIVGDIEHRTDQAFTPTSAVSDGTTFFALSDDNTAPHRGGIYFSVGAIDEFDPRGYIRIAATDVPILGTHVLGDTLICVTGAGSEKDGVVRVDGDPTRRLSFEGVPANPFAATIELVKGGIGGFNRPDTEVGHRAFSTMWSEGTTVVFIDSLGSIWGTDGRRCWRLDMFGPLPPRTGNVNDHVAAVGKHLFAWRDGRMLVMTALDYQSEDNYGVGCWTEVIPPSSDIKSMYGINDELYFLSQGQVWRMSKAAPRAERGRINNTPVDLTVSTRTIGEPDEQTRKHWHRFGVTFETVGGGTLKSLTSRSSSSRAANTASATYTVAVDKTVSDGEGRAVVPAGIGSQTLVSGTAVFQGDVRLQEFSFWFTGGVSAR